MPEFQYVGDDERTFPDLALSVTPGQTVVRDANPDEAFFVGLTLVEQAPKPTKAKTPAAPGDTE